ncbi:DNA-directed RNA polymerase subunit delta [Anaerocolumna sedimenticola]|uniref:DNA-directed RNA polymerase subunit delta n=1 Tax=Anaerocolumna sedimenticola TaxID=2696063 RepID=A0A6P1TIZ6_9FIRM|nr:S-adenosyl-l-methionine hydroxide adenosyltransferase family protein [Anaerocolumna sedimenticola]QHQ59605.1 DNA-directed RNA polymerase subunit delta [Anaerocolumna sedimenticola]
MNEKPILVFQTDFTYKEGAVCSMYGVVKSVDRSLEIFDGTHEIPHFDTWSASYRLYQSMRFWPKGTIFVSVVDPGVGTARKACAAKTADGYVVVTPDNGALTHLKKYVGIEEVREIDESVNRLQSTVGTSIFHGRDLFGYCAARLASGIITYEEVGPSYPVEEIVIHKIHEPKLEREKAEGIFEICDPNFGNLWSNIPVEEFLNNGFKYGDLLNVTIYHVDKLVYQEKVPFAKSFGFVKPGEAVVYTNELMKVAVAISMGNFRETYQVDFGQDWTLKIEK